MQVLQEGTRRLAYSHFCFFPFPFFAPEVNGFAVHVEYVCDLGLGFVGLEIEVFCQLLFVLCIFHSKVDSASPQPSFDFAHDDMAKERVRWNELRTIVFSFPGGEKLVFGAQISDGVLGNKNWGFMMCRFSLHDVPLMGHDVK